ncbi:O-antigen ligase family protein [Gemmata sp. JC673]|uniref:O-antigen ligase family protein n=1 Tax=Gemmata algarum TaxID=2975278 RepID=A0ABU5ERG4_9BACT|nr:O-antigen ligase family protein [Gemmata algarum]MDY3557829.1 O-antigen ligase family protein [Gemmata algarum]
MRTPSPRSSSASKHRASAASPVPRSLRGAGEAVLFALVTLAPWPFASNDPPFESALAAGVLLLVALWAAHAVATGRFALRPDVVTVSLSGIALWSAVQLVPLPESVVGVLSPARLEWHRTLVPDTSELLPGEVGATRPTALALSVDPAATRTFLARVLAVLLVYAAARNWLATPAGFRRLAWALTANGVALAVLALGQFFSSAPNVLFWSVRCEGAVFGPFVCRNHYPDYAAVCLGLAVGLMLHRERGRTRGGVPAGLLTPRNVGLAAAVGLMAASIAFSLSRGGILAVVAAGAGALLLSRPWRGRRGRRGNPAALAGAVLVAGGVFAWFGTVRIEQRLATFGSAETADSRTDLWRDAVDLVPRFWTSGTGGGTFVWAEPLVRTGRPTAAVESAHNEYLEAAVEGGVVRFGLTLLLAAGVAVAVARGFARKRERSAGPLILGAWFGLAAVALHAVAEFAVHMPAVALLAATVAGFAMAASDCDFERPPPAARERGWWTVGAGLAVAGLALFVALDARARERVHRLKLAADVTYRDTDSPDRLARRARYLDARVALRPDDPAVLFDAAQGQIDAAVEATLAGAPPGTEPPDRFPAEVVSRHIVPALRFLRAARAVTPIAPKPHTRLALLAEHFERSEPASVHFDRAKRLLPADADLWFTSGKAALRRGDRTSAWADWQKSLALSPRHLGAILLAAQEVLSGGEMREHVLPDEPVILLAATDLLYPDRTARAERQPFLEAVAACGDRSGATGAQLGAVARAHAELDHTEDALRAWQRAVAAAPDEFGIRDGYSRWLEQQERYEDAVPQLEWLRSRTQNGAIQDRLDAARHGLELKRVIEAN